MIPKTITDWIISFVVLIVVIVFSFLKLTYRKLWRMYEDYFTPIMTLVIVVTEEMIGVITT